MSLGNEVAKMYGEIGSIDSIVKVVISSPDVRMSALELIGDSIGWSLMRWNEEKPENERHKPAWISKKARDSVSELTDIVMRRVNLRLGLPPDAMP